MKKITSIINSFKGKNIAIIGDLMLDEYIFGDSERISPEAPVPVIHASRECSYPGGAGNVASNIVSLSANAILVGILGEDAAGKILLNLLNKLKVNTSGIFISKKINTIRKIRVIARGQHIVRVDWEKDEKSNSENEEKMIKFIEKNIKKWDAIILSDYNKGTLTSDLIKSIIKIANKNKVMVIGDTKPKNAHYFKNCFAITPNKKEAFEISGKENVKAAGKYIQKKLNCNILLTEGSDGMSLFTTSGSKSYPAKAKEIYDVAGAGDTVISSFTLALSAGASLEESTIVANHAAGIAVGKIGTSIVSPKELKMEFE